MMKQAAQLPVYFPLFGRKKTSTQSKYLERDDRWNPE
jgi:hypothetical protein